MQTAGKMKNGLLSQQIFERLEGDIGDRVYPPGSRLAEDVIARRLGVSRTPVREAFRMLERAGWIEIFPHTGAYVRNPPLDEVRQVFEVRQYLEERAAQLASQHATVAEMERMRKIIVRGRREVERGNTRAISSLNSSFHRYLAEASHNQILARMLEDLAKQVRWQISAVTTVRGEASWNEHEQILKAIESRDAQNAGKLAVAHRKRTQEAFFMRLIHGQDSITAESSPL